MIERFEREDGIGLEYAQNNMFIVRFDEAIEFPEWDVAKFVYNRDGTFTISVMDYVFIDTDDGVKYSTESYFMEKMKFRDFYTIKVEHSYGDGKVMYTEEFTNCRIRQVLPDNLDYGDSERVHKINVIFAYDEKKINF